MSCEPYDEGTIGAQFHCPCWFDDSDLFFPCCWCGDNSDGSDECRPLADPSP